VKIAIGADHRGSEVCHHVRTLVTSLGHQICESGACPDDHAGDYPDYGYPVAVDVSNGTADRGILICGSGIGMSITANKVKGVRAALALDAVAAEMSRRHNDANVLCLAADMLGQRLIDLIVTTWLKTEFEGGRHARRVAKITDIEQGRDPTKQAATTEP